MAEENVRKINVDDLPRKEKELTPDEEKEIVGGREASDKKPQDAEDAFQRGGEPQEK